MTTIDVLHDHIRKKCAWEHLPQSIQKHLGYSIKEYEKCVVNYSIRNQLRYEGNLVAHFARNNESKYYDELMDFSCKGLRLFPYHLSDVIIGRMGISPFRYYLNMLDTLINQGKSYDSMPNFTAADCLRLAGIGRNQYIDLMNKIRSQKSFTFFRKTCARELLPKHPISQFIIEPWWIVNCCRFKPETDQLDKAERCLIEQLVDSGACLAAQLDMRTIRSLHALGLVYFDVPISVNDYVYVPPLQGFVMNRVLGDDFENLIYKVFVSIDETTNVLDLAHVLDVDPQSIQDVVSLYCRLGFARKKKEEEITIINGEEDDDSLLLNEINKTLTLVDDVEEDRSIYSASPIPSDEVNAKKIAFLYDSTLTAYLMMGNLSHGLKNHAVTMFEVGKLPDESLDGLIVELEKVIPMEGEGDVNKYFIHAVSLRETVFFFRHNEIFPLGLDLIRCESLQSLNSATLSRLFAKNYSLVVSMAPLTYGVLNLDVIDAPYLGPAIPEVASIWFRLFLYNRMGCGPPSLLLTRGTRIRRLPPEFEDYDWILFTSWGHEPTIVAVDVALGMLIDSIQHSAILLQACCEGATTKLLVFPDSEIVPILPSKLSQFVDLNHNCGYVTLMKLHKDKDEWVLFDVTFGLPLFDLDLNRSVRASIIDNSLWRSDNLDLMRASRTKMLSELIGFIEECQDKSFNYEKDIVFANHCVIQMPTKNLFFKNGKCMNLSCD